MTPRAGLILANRAYCDHDAPPGEENGPPNGSGGLLAALRAAMSPWDGESGTVWVGAGRGACDAQFTDERGYELIETPRGPLRHRRLFFDEETWRGHYAVSANSFLWPLLHLVREPLPEATGYYPRPHVPGADEWEAHRRVNRAFAEAALEEDCPTWVHDYQLALTPALLRKAGFARPVGFFLHTPFPELGLVRRYLDDWGMDCLREVVAGILGADLVGLQSDADAERFVRACEGLGLGSACDAGLRVGERTVRVGTYPVGLDVREVLREAHEAETPEVVRRARTMGLPLVIGLERADFTKGIPERFAAIEALYERGLRFAYVGIASPTRKGVAAYSELRPAIEGGAEACARAAGRLGCSFTYREQSMPWHEVVALQREADVVFTSSLSDGMNLVPLQSAMAQSLRPPGDRAVIIAGRDSGVAEVYRGFERDGLVAVNPLDREAMAATLERALRGEPGRITDRLVDAVRGQDAGAWAERFLGDLEGGEC